MTECRRDWIWWHWACGPLGSPIAHQVSWGVRVREEAWANNFPTRWIRWSVQEELWSR